MATPGIRGVVAATAACLVLLAAPAAASAHDGEVDAVPPSGSTLDEPITEVELTFQTEIGEDVEIALLDPDETPIATEATKVSDRVATAQFDPLEQEGTYIVRYLGTAVADGHLLVGAVSFTYGSDGGGSSVLPWVLFAVAAIAILAVGASLSVLVHRRNLAAADQFDAETDIDPDGDDSGDVDQDLPDVRV